MNESIIFVCATDDGINFSKDHFGSAKTYLFYSLDLVNEQIQFLKKLENSTPDEESHGDPKKAKAVSVMLSGVQVLINLVFGPNISRIRKKFVPIISKEPNIKKSLEKIRGVLDKIKVSLNQIGDKDIIFIDGKDY